MIGSAALFGATSLGLGLPAAALLAVLADGIFRPSSSTFYPTISHGPRGRPKVALTFDDGPHPDVTPRVLDILAAHGARATFFMIGRYLERNLAIGARAAREGHQIGNHSWQHSYLQNFYSSRAYLHDIERTEALIRGIVGNAASIPFRTPVGHKSPDFARAAHVRGLQVVAWSLHSRDTIDRNPARVARRVLSRVRPGDIVLMHDGHQDPGGHRRSALEALPAILDGLRQRGLQPVTLNELLS